MKKISLLTLGCMAVASVMAQDNPGNTPTASNTKDYKPLRTEMSRKVRFGLQGGLNLAKFSMSNVPNASDPTMKTSFYGGAFVNIPLGPIRIQPGVMWNGLGSKYERSFAANTAKAAYEQDLHYITVPVMLQVMPGHNGFFIEAGPYISYLTTAKYEFQNSGAIQANDPYNKLEFDKTDFGAIGGIGYLTRVGLGFTASYLNGFTNVVKDDSQRSRDGEKFRNRAWRLGLVYHFGAAK
ncbi:MAG: PorT family protein [Chitinophagaceae bacterium]|nr:MAG: PorT family protein [Chitinophagaceae bacterium]